MKQIDFKGAACKPIWRSGAACKPILRSQAGLTSVQIIVVVAVIGIIAAVLLAPRLLGQAGRSLQAQAAENRNPRHRTRSIRRR